MRSDNIPTRPDTKEVAPVKCAGCERDTVKGSTFVCRKCKRSPFCFEHLDKEFRICSGCAFEKRTRLYDNLLKQEQSLRGFLRLVQFIFVFSAVLFSSSRLFAEHIPDYVRENIFLEYLSVWGGLSVIGIVVCHILLFSQRKKLSALNERIHASTAEKRFSRLL